TLSLFGFLLSFECWIALRCGGFASSWCGGKTDGGAIPGHKPEWYLSGWAQLHQPGQGGRRTGDPPRFDPGAQWRGAGQTNLPVQRGGQKPLRGSVASGLPDRRGPERLRGAGWPPNRLTKPQTTHCFPAISDYIAPQ